MCLDPWEPEEGFIGLSIIHIVPKRTLRENNQKNHPPNTYIEFHVTFTQLYAVKCNE